MIVKKMFGFLIDDKFVSHEELALEFEKLQAENKKLREALEKITAIRRKDGNDNDYEGSEVYIAREALKEVGEK
jgi:hypothetical protein